MLFKDIYVVVPAYNEQKVIKDIINNLLKKFPNVIVVNDGSNDRTLEIINELVYTYLHIFNTYEFKTT